MTELWLSSEDTGAYGRDLAFPPDNDDDGVKAPRPGLTRLLGALLSALPPRAMLRLGMTNPPFILDQLEAVAAALRHPNVYSFLHIPVQAGSDAVRCVEWLRRLLCVMWTGLNWVRTWGATNTPTYPDQSTRLVNE